MAWSRDGSKLVVPLQAPESSTVYTFDPTTGALHNLAIPGPVSVPVLASSDGSAYYDNEPATNGVMSLPGGTVLGHVLNGFPTDLSRDGTRALVPDSGLSVVDVATDERTHVLDGRIQDAVWSPDETQIAYIDNQHLGVLDIATGKTRELLPDLKAMYASNFSGNGYLAWSPDGKQIAVGDWQASGINGKAQIYIVDAKSGSKRQVTKTAASYRYFAFSPDGKRLAFVDQEKNNLIIVDLSSGSSRTVAGSDNTFAWVSDTQLASDTGDGIALISTDGATRLLISNTSLACRRFLITWSAPNLVFSSICTHRGL